MLSQGQLAAAQAYNEVAGKRGILPTKNLPPWLSSCLPVGSKKFVEAVFAFQKGRGLQADGKFGGSVLTALIAETADRTDGILVFGERVKVPGVTVVDYRDPGSLNFYGHPTHYSPRKLKILSIVLHDSITRTAADCFVALVVRVSKDTGKNLGLSTHFTADRDGVVYQHLDPADQARHTKTPGWNGVSVGFDLAGLLDPELLRKGEKEPLNTAPWAGTKDKRYVDYPPAQVAALRGVLLALCGALDVPFDVPRGPAGTPLYRPKGKVLDLDPKRYRGVVAHGNIQDTRWDGHAAVRALFEGTGAVA